MMASSVLSNNRFKSAWNMFLKELQSLIIASLGFGVVAGSIVFLV